GRRGAAAAAVQRDRVHQGGRRLLGRPGAVAQGGRVPAAGLGVAGDHGRLLPRARSASVWREIMDRFSPGSGWIRVRRDTLDALQRFKAVRALPTWDDALEALFKEA